jgi:pSer/pThr/pTyr-binding forkhead associated (FHA) protein
VSGSWILLVRTGRQAGAKAVVAPGGALRVGHAAPADLVIDQDRELSVVHFVLTVDHGMCTIEDANSERGIAVNGQPVASGPVEHGDWIRAGDTDFSLYREAHTPPLEDVVPTPAKAAALAALRAEREPVLAVLDAARDERILQLVRESAEEARSLYDGFRGESMADGAPYLVQVGTGALLERLVMEGWGKSWGIYLTSPRPFVEVRRHLRRFLIVLDDDSEARLYFRFYDPRVLRVFFPTATRRQSADLFGEVSQFSMEDGGGALLRFAKPGAAASS